MCVSRCLHCVGISLIPMAIICMVCNSLLLFPNLKANFLLEGHVTREATWSTGLWGSGFVVLLSARTFVQSSQTKGCFAFRRKMVCQVVQSCLCLLAAAFCCLVSFHGLAQGPLCQYNTTSGLTWGVPLQPDLDIPGSGYLYNRTLWSGVCMEPRNVVVWNVVLFSVMGGVSGLQTLLCAANILNTLLGLVLGHGFCHNKVTPVSV
ncbi:transmembrane 4 L6 family member 19 isoform X2 [Nelusetta ayraudi]|uniref:transmembrane 4 L6 family member 19 isoform X2 n=1 Tax=Nelusetta ayraudi TaxID=303726 RepID=UPI003F702D02